MKQINKSMIDQRRQNFDYRKRIRLYDRLMVLMLLSIAIIAIINLTVQS